MRYRVLLTLALVISGSQHVAAVEGGNVALTIVRAETKVRDRVLSYVVNTPIYRQDPYFEVVVRSERFEFEGQRDPESPREMLPEYWKPGAGIQGRVDKRHLYLRRQNGTEVRFIITRRSRILE